MLIHKFDWRSIWISWLPSSSVDNTLAWNVGFVTLFEKLLELVTTLLYVLLFTSETLYLLGTNKPFDHIGTLFDIDMNSGGTFCSRGVDTGVAV